METLKIYKVIEQIWNDHYTTNTIGKLHLTLDNLWHWGKKEFGNPSTEIKRIKEVIQALQIDNQHNKNYKTIKRIRRSCIISSTKRTFGGSKGKKMHWLREWDMNTSFFHQKASQR